VFYGLNSDKADLYIFAAI